MPEKPHLRFLEPIPVESDGQNLVVLRDPLRFVLDPLTVSVPVYLLMTLMNGERSLFDIEKEFRKRFGGRISTADLEKLVSDLEEIGLLQGARFEQIRNRVLADFGASPVREAAHAGSAYEDKPAALRKQIDGFYEATEKLPPAEANTFNGAVRGIIAPHIDPRVGGICFAKAFSALREIDPPPELFVVFGTAHQPGDSLFTLTEKAFDTPLGTVEVDHEVATALRAECSPMDLTADEYLHKHEHSIEFQLIFLQHFYGERHSFQILPILVGSFYDFIEGNSFPSSDDRVRTFTQSLRSALRQSGKRVCCIAGADLSHMGPRFGDPEDVSEALAGETQADDLKLLNHLQAGDHEGFFRHLQATGDRQKVCGLPPIYIMMHLLDRPLSGELLQYDFTTEDTMQSLVSYVGMVFRGGE